MDDYIYLVTYIQRNPNAADFGVKQAVIATVSALPQNLEAKLKAYHEDFNDRHLRLNQSWEVYYLEFLGKKPTVLWKHLQVGDEVQIWDEEPMNFGSPFTNGNKVVAVDHLKEVVIIGVSYPQEFCMRTGYRLGDGLYRISGRTKQTNKES